jgi:copper transport protein
VLDGHQRSVDPQWLLVGADLVHLLGAAAWLGGLVLLATAVRARRLDDDPVAAASLVVRFSRVALWSVVALTVAGVAMSWALVRTPRALTSTGYGWTLVAKLAVVVVVVAAAAYNQRRLVPAIAARRAPAGAATDLADGPDRAQRRSLAAWRQLRATLLVEVVGVATVLALTGFLVSQRPAAEAAGVTAAFEGRAALGDDLRVDLIVDPNRAGRNAIHVYVVDDAGLPAGEVEDLRLELTYVEEAIGPFVVEPFPAGAGHWTATVDDLAFPGAWNIRVVAGVDRFAEAAAELEVVVNR